MHSTIFQITKTRVEKENFLNEDTLIRGTTAISTIAPRWTTRYGKRKSTIW